MRKSLLAGLLMLAALPGVSGQPASASADVCRPVLSGFTAPAVAYAGDTVSGTVSLSCAPTSDVQVALSSDNSSLTVPSTVTVRRAQTTAAVSLNAALVNGPQYTAHVTARYRGQSHGQDVTVNPGLKAVSIPQSSAPNDVNLDVNLTGAAPAGGITVRLASDNPAITVPDTYSIPAGAVGVLTGGSEIKVLPVSQDTTVTISVTLGTRTLTASKVLVPPFDGSQPVSIRAQNEGDLYGLQFNQQFDVVLADPAPEGGVPVQVSVVGDDPAVRLETTNADVAAGSTTGSFFLDTADVTHTTKVTLKATALQATAYLEITIHPRITAVTLPASAPSGTTFEGSITLAGPSDVDTEIFLQQSWGILDVPSTVTIPAGSTSVTFPMTSVHVDEPSDVSVTAYLGATHIESNSVTLTP